MQVLVEYLPYIIKEAASSNLGIVALMLILFSGLAYSFFRESKDAWRFSALILLFVGCVSFGYAVFKENPPPGNGNSHYVETVSPKESIDIGIEKYENQTIRN